jgi:site-specific DNA-methyltransferase (adenine-specific)
VEIAKRLIGMFSFVGDTVLDPFLGSGSTTIAAIQMHRSSIGLDIEPEYIDLVRSRIGTPDLGASVRYRALSPGSTR